jgi:tetratricopeptide (TPR) repeat protein
MEVIMKRSFYWGLRAHLLLVTAFLLMFFVTDATVWGQGVYRTAEDYYERGMENLNSEFPGGAIAAFTEAIKINPNYVDAMIGKGLAYEQMGEFGWAIDQYNTALRIAPNNAFAYGCRGGAYQQKGDHDSAIVDYNQAIRLDPNDIFSYNNRGWAYYQKGNYAQARTDSNRALQIDPNFEGAKRLSAELRQKGY